MGKTSLKSFMAVMLGCICSATFVFSNSQVFEKNLTVAEASNTGADIRITVVRPSWWAGYSAYQPLRIAASSSDLDTKTNVTYISPTGYVDSGYYSPSNAVPSFTEYDTDGILFYDIPLATISGKFFDLARLSSTDTVTATVWNNTPNETFTVGLNTSIWRIFNDSNGIFRPTGTSAESRSINNEGISAILYGYLTCSSSESNGFGAYPSLRDNFDLEGRTFLESDTLTDYEYYATYTADRTGITVKTSDKVAAMKLAYEASLVPETLNVQTFLENEKLLNILLVISVLSLSIIIGYSILLRKKKIA